ncbi:MAG: hypothetical protein JSV77_07390 [Dehalococcoidales bacterium]|nr:MAG: hypothetical protein JSV77_07390 [Dehalococcoidales bacterium]
MVLVVLVASSAVTPLGCDFFADVAESTSELFGDGGQEVEGYSGAYVIYHDRQPRHLKSPSGESAQLVNNEESTDPTWLELMTFLGLDTTDEKPYVVDSYSCVAFAEELHNNAEAAGIKAAFVGVQFEDRDIGHALNAFQTTDRGLVFIDCTSSIRSGLTYRPMLELDTGETGEAVEVQAVGADKVAYVEIGEEYGVISIEVATSPEYSFYQNYLAEREQFVLDVEAFNRDLDIYNQRVDVYNQEVDAYNQTMETYEQEVAEYNEAIGGRTGLPEPEYSQFQEWAAELEANLITLMGIKAELESEQWELMSILVGLNERQLELEAASDEIGDVNWRPLAVVESIKVYW